MYRGWRNIKSLFLSLFMRPSSTRKKAAEKKAPCEQWKILTEPFLRLFFCRCQWIGTAEKNIVELNSARLQTPENRTENSFAFFNKCGSRVRWRNKKEFASFLT